MSVISIYIGYVHFNNLSTFINRKGTAEMRRIINKEMYHHHRTLYYLRHI